MAASILSTRGLRWDVGGATIVADVTLDVPAGECLGIIGPNGAGKTSLFNLLSGLIRPSGGTIELAGTEITNAPPYVRTQAGLGRTFQVSSVFPLLTVFENVRLALSHGDKRKLELAMLLAADRQVILLDEPMAGVSAEEVEGLTELIRSVHREEGRTVLMVEHHMEVVTGVAERIAVMHHGALLACDTPQAVMANETVQQAYLGEPL
jgi:branched-chain amino acid transport system ATP-binding protein